MDITDVFGTSVKNSVATDKKQAEQLRKSKRLSEQASNKKQVGELAVGDTQPYTINNEDIIQ